MLPKKVQAVRFFLAEPNKDVIKIQKKEKGE